MPDVRMHRPAGRCGRCSQACIARRAHRPPLSLSPAPQVAESTSDDPYCKNNDVALSLFVSSLFLTGIVGAFAGSWTCNAWVAGQSTAPLTRLQQPQPPLHTPRVTHAQLLMPAWAAPSAAAGGAAASP
jgi:hypothetical protein